MPALTIELAGGLESYFRDQPKLVLTTEALESNSFTNIVTSLPKTMRDLLFLLKNNFLSVKEDLFVEPMEDATGVSFTVRPGILTLVDDVDWEILGMLDAQLDGAKRVTFISTLHGG